MCKFVLFVCLFLVPRNNEMYVSVLSYIEFDLCEIVFLFSKSSMLKKKKRNNLLKLHCETLQRRKIPTHLNVLQPLKLNMTWFSQVKPRKGGKHSKNCWICHTCFSEHPYSCGNECSHYRFLQYLHTGKLSRYFLRWLVLILGNQ